MAKRYYQSKPVTLRNKILDKMRRLDINDDKELDLNVPKRFEGDDDDDGDCDMY